jgi:hypothetical protein
MIPAIPRSSLLLLSLLVACGEGDKKPAKADEKAKAAPAAEQKPYEPAQEPLVGPAAPTILLSQAWFNKNAAGKSVPGPARLQIWRQGAEGWKASRLEDGDSNVFHKALLRDGKIFTIAGEKANLKVWGFADGKWSQETLWSKSWGGKFNRIRDLEIGDVDGDGKDEWVMATHDGGVIAVYNPPETPGAAPEIIELDAKPDTFVHEIEIGDIDGDGTMEFFATPSDRNSSSDSQPGFVVMYRFDGTTYKRTVVDGEAGHTHAKEILVSDLDGDKKAEFFSVQEAQVKGNQILHPVEIRQYTLQKDGTFKAEAIATINDRQTRFLLGADFDGDGKKELIAAAMKTGLYRLTPGKPGEPWAQTNFDAISGGFEHAMHAFDMDGNGAPELYVASDDQQELKSYVWNAATSSFDRTLIGKMEKGVITWNIEAGKL